MQSETKICQNCKKKFVIEPDDFGFYEKIKVPPPTFCPECRYQRRLINRNEWNFYKRRCSLCQRDMISIYNPEYKGPVYCQKCWWGDAWDPSAYKQNFDFSKSFFEQYFELQKAVPRLSMVSEYSVNSEYTNQSERNKNCYFLIASGDCEDCMYGNWNAFSRECVDCYMIERCELLYECVDCRNCYRSSFLYHCYDAVECHFSYDCVGCTNCFGCVGLRQQSYCFFNKQLSKEEYEKAVKNFSLSLTDVKKAKQKLFDFVSTFPKKYYHGVNIKDSTGDYIEHCATSRDIFNCRHTRDISHSQDAWSAEDSYDLTEIANIEMSYELQGCDNCPRSMVLRSCWTNDDCFYCDLCFGNSDLFGCIGVRDKKYCILNKQYSKENYLALKEKIISHMKTTKEWGEYTPAWLTPFAYNESVAQEYFPLNKNEALAKGYKWYERPQRNYFITKKYGDLPPGIDDISDSIINEVIGCLSQETDADKKKYIDCTTAFRITRDELTLYKKMKIPLPEKCFPCRRQDRFALRNPRKLWRRVCMCNKMNHFHKKAKCEVEFETSYAPDRPEIVYCEKCYQAEVY